MMLTEGCGIMYTQFLGNISSFQFTLSSVRLFVTPWTAARQASLSITNFTFSYKADFSQTVNWTKASHALNFPFWKLWVSFSSNCSTLCWKVKLAVTTSTCSKKHFFVKLSRISSKHLQLNFHPCTLPRLTFL